MASETGHALERPTDATTVAVAVGGGLVLGLYASWMAADLVARWLVFLVVAVGAGYALFDQPDVRAQVAYGCYVLAGLLVLTPILMLFPDVLSGSEYGVGAVGMAAQLANLILLLVFGLLAAIVAYAGYRASGGRGVLERLRNYRTTG